METDNARNSPSEPQRSAGTYIVLWHIERARQLGLAYVYLGYWIGGCGKMSYKTRFRPIEALGPNGWSVMGETPDGHTPPG